MVGAVGSWLLAKALKGFLFGATSTDPVTFAGRLLIVTAVALISGYLPARPRVAHRPGGRLRPCGGEAARGRRLDFYHRGI